MGKLRKLLLLVTLSPLLSCVDKLPSESNLSFCPGLKSDDGSCMGSNPGYVSSWDFATSSEYNFDASQLKFDSGRVMLKSVTSKSSGEDFESGIFQGIVYDSSTENLTLSDRNPFSYSDVASLISTKNSNLVANFRMENNWTDSVGTISPASIGTPSFSTNSISGNYSANFNGTTDALDLGVVNRVNSATSLTVCTWVYHTSITDDDYILGNGGGDSKFLFLRDNSGATSGRSDVYTVVADDGPDFARIESEANRSPLETWTHLCFTFQANSSNGLRLFIDGIEDAYSPVSTIGVDHINSSGENLIAGKIPSANSSFFSGLMDDLNIWDTVLTPEEIKTIYQAQVTGYTNLRSEWTPQFDNLFGYWKMDQNWKDSSFNGNEATPTPSPTFSSNSKVGNFSGNFNGAQSLTLPPSDQLIPSSNHPISIMFWANPQSIASASNLIRLINIHKGSTKGSALAITLGNDNEIQYYNSANASTTSWTNKVRLNEWVHIGLVYTGTCFQKYFNGSTDGTCQVKSLDAGGTYQARIGSYDSAQYFYNGLLDEMAIWDVALTAEDVHKIYDRQKQKAAGSYESKIYSTGALASWTGLSPETEKPFMKELVRTSESSNYYPSIYSNLMDGLIASWSLNGSSGTISDDAVIRELNGLDGVAKDSDVTNTMKYTDGIVGSGIYFDGTNDYIDLGNSVNLKPDFPFSLSTWVKIDKNDVTNVIFANDYKVSGYRGASIYISTTGKPAVRFGDGGGAAPASRRSVLSSVTLEIGKWYHLAFVFSSLTNADFYINGVLDTALVKSGSGGAVEYSTNSVFIGKDEYSGEFFNGSIDELSLWSRSLTSEQVTELYRRGANRIKYQVRSCANSDCSDKDFQGPDGTSLSYFSEVYNNDSINSSAVPVGDPLSTSPIFTFTNFLSPPADANYFQYKVFMESEDENGLCSGFNCVPSLTAMQISPTSQYYVGENEISTKNAISYQSILGISFTESSNCTIKYQLSNDSTNFYYWDGSNWTLASTSIQSNPSTEVSSNIEKYSAAFAPGDLYIKAILKSVGGQDCYLDSISLELEE